MPPGLGALLLVGTVALVGGELMVVDDSNWWETCKTPVCTVAEEQAEGLARLRVLSNYIKETMSLMGSVVASLDNEMQEVGQELRTIVGRRCHARGHAGAALTALVMHVNQTDGADNEIIVEVDRDEDDSWTSSSEVTQESSSVWSSEVGATSGSSSLSQSTSHRPGSTSHGTHHGTSQRPSSTSHATEQHTTGTWRGSPQYPSSTSQTTQHHGSDLLTSSSTSSSSSHSSSTSDSSGKTLYRRPSSTLKRYEAESSEEYDSPYVAPAQPETSDWRGGGQGRHGQGYGPGHGRGGGHGRGRGNSGGRGRGRGQGLGLNLGLVSVSLGSSECWGVPVGSPHYVPGLDSWCAKNCASPNRYCPETHCICP